MAFLRALYRPLLCTSGADASHDPMEANSLRVSDVKHMFRLSMTILHGREPWRLRKEDLLDIPESLREDLDQIAKMLYVPATPVAFDSRSRLDAFMKDAVVAEQTLARASLFPLPQDKYPFFATLRRSLTDTVRFRGKARILQAMANYCVLSDGNRRYLSTKFVVVAAEAKPRVAGVCQCLSYMAMVHRMRKEEGWDPVVYGCYSDGFQFTFYRIDYKSRVSSRTYCWGKDNDSTDARRIYTHLRLIVRSSAKESARSGP